MQFFYDTAMQLFTKGMQAASIFNPKAKKAVQGRNNWYKELSAQVISNQNWIWMHCSSLGEFEQGRPVFDRLAEVFPNHKLALSFFSPSGYEIRKDYPQADIVFYLPFDAKKNAKKLAEIFQPEYLILVKYDYWFNHLQAQKEIGTKIIVVSAIFRPNQLYFKKLGKWMAKQLKQNIDHFFVQDEQSQELLQRIDIKEVTISGDTRFDRVKTIAEKTIQLDWVREFKGNQKLCVIGSSWPKDEDLWAKLLNHNAFPNWKFIIAPHQIGPNHIQEISNQFNLSSIHYSEIQQNTDVAEHQLIIVDAIGLLSRIYASADIAYVGGGFKSSGVHNTLEPAVFGVPVVIGPNYYKFNEVKLLRDNHILFPISNYTEFQRVINELFYNEEKRSEVKAHAKKVFNQQLPSTEIILDYLTKHANN